MYPEEQRAQPAERVACVGAVVTDGAGRLLLIRRGRPPGVGLWSLPGGRVEPGESEEQALAREVLEETGLLVTVGPLLGRVERPAPDGRVYDIGDYTCEVTGGELAAGDDAAAAGWFTVEQLPRLPTTEGLLPALQAWDRLPR